jgi:hypothetical protein
MTSWDPATVTSAELSRRDLVGERARHVRNGAVGVGVGLLVLAVLRDIVGLHGDAGTLGQVWQAALRFAVGVAFVAQSVRVGAHFPEGLHQPGDRRLPRWGQASRLTFRTSAGVAACAYLIWGALLTSGIEDGGVGPRFVSEWLGGALAVVLFLPSLLALGSGLVWAAAEVYMGYREPRRRPMRTEATSGQMERPQP